MADVLSALSDDLLVAIGAYLTSVDLAQLEATCHRFHNGPGGGLTEHAAWTALRARSDAWRVERRPEESAKFVLFLVERQVAGPTPLAAGKAHTLAISAISRMCFAFGCDEMGQLGLAIGSVDDDDREDEQPSPKPVSGDLKRADVFSVAAGDEHSAAVVEGQCYTWGAMGSGRLGHGRTGPETAVTSATPVFGMQTSQSPLLSTARVSMVACGGSHTACVTAAGELFTWGECGRGQLGIGDVWTTKVLGVNRVYHQCSSPHRVHELADRRVIQVSCGSESTGAIVKDPNHRGSGGRLFMCGRIPRPDQRCAVGWFNALSPMQIEVHDESGGGYVTHVSCGGAHFAAIGRSGKLFTWGRGFGGRLGHGDDSMVEAPRVVAAFEGQRMALVECGGGHTVAVCAQNRVAYSWGLGQCGQLGHLMFNHVQEEVCWVPARINLPGAGGRVSSLSCGDSHTVLQLAGESGKILAFGLGENGQLGQERPAHVEQCRQSSSSSSSIDCSAVGEDKRHEDEAGKQNEVGGEEDEGWEGQDDDDGGDPDVEDPFDNSWLPRVVKLPHVHLQPWQSAAATDNDDHHHHENGDGDELLAEPRLSDSTIRLSLE